MLEFFETHESLMKVLGLSSIGILLLVLILLPFIIIQMPTDYFVDEHHTLCPWRKSHPILCLLYLLVKNLLGVGFLILGLIMLVMPGQGLLLIMMGLLLMNYPGKTKMERQLAAGKGIRSTLNRIRSKAGKPPLL